MAMHVASLIDAAVSRLLFAIDDTHTSRLGESSYVTYTLNSLLST